MAAFVVALAVEHGRNAGLNIVGECDDLPYYKSSELMSEDAFGWPGFGGRARMPEAWQLVEVYRAVRLLHPLVKIGILDGGFWMKGWLPGSDSKAPDYRYGVTPYNLTDGSTLAGGPNPNKCTGGEPCSWHGNGVASVAAASVDNGLGAAGTGGTVAAPVFFKSELNAFEVLHCLELCLAWGVDILNMSFHLSVPPILGFGSIPGWESCFQQAADKGLILIASAGNHGVEMPKFEQPRPATRTPGVITVGALQGEDRADYSNYGPAVDVWAAGTQRVVPDPDTKGSNSWQEGTSLAAPFVAGVAAMMRAVNPDLDTFDTLRLLKASGWKGSGPVTVGVDAYAAVLAAMGGKLPADPAEPNDSPASAGPLYPGGPYGRLVPSLPFGRAVLANPSDEDWYRLNVADFARLFVDIAYYDRLGIVDVSLHPDDPNSRAVGDLKFDRHPGYAGFYGPVAPGEYKLRVRGDAMNLYELLVDLDSEPLERDEFEMNDDFAHATRFHLAKPGSTAPAFAPAVDILERGPGVHELTLLPNDLDLFRIRVDALGGSVFQARLAIAKTDAPITLRFFDGKKALLREVKDARSTELLLADASITYVQVSAPAPSRYQLTLGFRIDPSALPLPLKEKPVFALPDMLGPVIFLDDVSYFFVLLPRRRLARRPIAFAASGGEGFRMDLLDGAGRLAREGRTVGGGDRHRVQVATDGLRAGGHFLRLAPDGAAPVRIERVPAKALDVTGSI
jgi:hypothetical protein